MEFTRTVCLGLLLVASSSTSAAHPFEQRGPTGDNRAATGSVGTQQPLSGNGKEAAKQRRPMKASREGQSRHQQNPDTAAPTASPGTPAENNAAPEQAK